MPTVSPPASSTDKADATTPQLRHVRRLPLSGSGQTHVLALLADGSVLVARQSGHKRPVGVDDVVLMTGSGEQVAYSPRDPRLQIVYADGNARFVVWSETHSVTLDAPDWVLRAYDRRTHREWVVARAPRGTRGTEPKPAVSAGRVWWSSDSPDNGTLATWNARLRPDARPQLVRMNAAQPTPADNGVYYLVRDGKSNRLALRTLAGREQPTGISNVASYAITDEGTAWVGRDDTATLKWSPHPGLDAPELNIPLDSVFYDMSGGRSLIAFNTESTGTIYDVDSDATRTLSHDDARNLVQARGCWVFWQDWKPHAAAYVANTC